MTYGTDRLLAEVSYIAMYFHWPLSELLDLEHHDRQRFVAEIGRLSGRRPWE